MTTVTVCHTPFDAGDCYHVHVRSDIVTPDDAEQGDAKPRSVLRVETPQDKQRASFGRRTAPNQPLASNQAAEVRQTRKNATTRTFSVVGSSSRSGTNFWMPLRINPENDLYDLVSEDAKAGESGFNSIGRMGTTSPSSTRLKFQRRTVTPRKAIGRALDIGETALITGCALEGQFSD